MAPRNTVGRSRAFIRALTMLTLGAGIATATAADFIWQGDCGSTGWYTTCTGDQCAVDPDRWWSLNNWGMSSCGGTPLFPGTADNAYLYPTPVLLTSTASINYVDVPGGGLLTVSGLPAVLTPAAGLFNGGQLVVQDGATLYVADCTCTNNGILVLRYGGMWGYGKMECHGSTWLTGTGTLAFEGGYINGAGTLSQGADHTIRGAGGSISAGLNNAGLVSADVAGTALVLEGVAKTNQGRIQVVSGSYLDLHTAVTQTPTGEMRASGADSRLRLHNGASITGGLLTTYADGAITCGQETATFTDVTSTAGVTFADGATLNVTGTSFTNDGVLNLLYGGYAGAAHLVVAGGVTWQGSGAIYIGNGTIDSTGSLGFTHAAGHTIHGGSGTIGAALANYGVISADVAGQSLVFNDNLKTNHGTIEAVSGGDLEFRTLLTQAPTGEVRAAGADSYVRLHNGAIIVGGTLTTTDGGLFTCSGGETATLSDLTNAGEIQCADGATLVLDGTTLVNNGLVGLYFGGMYGSAHLRIDDIVTIGGTGSIWISSGNIATGAGVAASLTNGPDHTIHGGGPLNAALLNQGALIADSATALTINPQTPGVTNAGRLEAQPGRTLTINNAGLFTQTAGKTVANGTLAVNGAALNLQGGTLNGTGTVAGAVNNAGAAVEPGTSAGTLTISGGYTQGAAGVLDIQLGGPTAGSEHDRLAVGGAAALAGELHVTTINGFEPTVGQQFVILTAGSVTGTFATTTGTVPCEVTYNPTNVTITIAPPPPCHGDANCDGQIDFADINPFVDALVHGLYCDGTGVTADVNGDGAPDFGDINPFVDMLVQNPLPIACP